MVSMALTNQRRPRKGRNTPYAPDHEWKANQERLFARFFFQRKRTAAVLDDEVIDEVDKAIALASPEELDRLERPTARSAPQQPVNFAGASFSGCTINFSFNS